MENANLAVTANQTLTADKPVFSLLLKPVSSNEDIMKAWTNYQALKAQLLTKEDFVVINGEEFAKKSAYRRLALAFGVSLEVVRENRLELPNGVFAYEITVKAISPNGRFMTAVGSCLSNERKFSKPSDVYAIAQTRATNRAVSDLLGGVLGVSAEEIIAEAPALDDSFRPNPENSLQLATDNYIADPFGEDEEEEVEEEAMPATQKQKDLIVKLVDQKLGGPGRESIRSYYARGLEAMGRGEASQRIGGLLRLH